jgi:hypothetical protein
MLLLTIAAAAGTASAPILSDDAASCLAHRAKREVVALAAVEPGTPTEPKALGKLKPFLGRCSAGAAPDDEEGAAFYRAALSRAAAQAFLRSIHAGPPSNPNFSPNMFVVERGFDQAQVMREPDRLAACIVTVNLNGAARLVMSAPGSTEDKAAMAALMPNISSCLDRGRQLAIPAATLRAAIEIVFAYQMAKALAMVAPLQR